MVGFVLLSCGEGINRGTPPVTNILNGVYINISYTGYEQIIERYQFTSDGILPSGTYTNKKIIQNLDPDTPSEINETVMTITGTYQWAQHEGYTYTFGENASDFIPLNHIMFIETSREASGANATSFDTSILYRHILSIYVDHEKVSLRPFVLRNDLEETPIYNTDDEVDLDFEGIWQSYFQLYQPHDLLEWAPVVSVYDKYVLYDNGRFTWERSENYPGRVPIASKKPVVSGAEKPFYYYYGTAGFELDGVKKPAYLTDEALLMDYPIYTKETLN